MADLSSMTAFPALSRLRAFDPTPLLFDIGGIAFACLAYPLLPFFSTYLTPSDFRVLFFLGAGAIILKTVRFLLAPRTYRSRHVEPAFRGLCRLARRLRFSTSTPVNLLGGERTSLLFLGIKFYFLPLMIHFAISSLERFYLILDSIFSTSSHLSPADAYILLFAPLGIALLFFIDTAFFVIGYALEEERLGNIVQSVEPTLLGWAVTLVCYSPFRDWFAASVIGGYGQDFRIFPSPLLTIIAVTLALVLYAVYAWASAALGARASNLTHRGIVTSGPYAVVRHPAYITKNIAWWLSIIPLFLASPGTSGSIAIVVSTAVWSGIYYLRAITEERHLSRDPFYRNYMRAVPYRFIPGLW
jgi:protein-S-isoprenylcysteine O-methyltransferase Ste14